MTVKELFEFVVDPSINETNIEVLCSWSYLQKRSSLSFFFLPIGLLGEDGSDFCWTKCQRGRIDRRRIGKGRSFQANLYSPKIGRGIAPLIFNLDGSAVFLTILICRLYFMKETFDKLKPARKRNSSIARWLESRPTCLALSKFQRSSISLFPLWKVTGVVESHRTMIRRTKTETKNSWAVRGLVMNHPTAKRYYLQKPNIFLDSFLMINSF